jgi:hypothetical protein
MRANIIVVAVLGAMGGPRATRGWAAPEPAAKTEAHDRFAQGLRLYEKGENAAALAELERAYELIPSWSDGRSGGIVAFRRL